MTDTELEAWLTERKAVHSKATEGPWEAEREEGNIISPTQGNVVEVFSWIDADAIAIADAHNHLPALIAVVEAVLKRHQRGQPYLLAVEWVCEGCSDNEDEREVPWPCPTVRAIEAVIGDE